MNDLHQSELDKAARNDHTLDDLAKKTGGEKTADGKTVGQQGVTADDLAKLMPQQRTTRSA